MGKRTAHYTAKVVFSFVEGAQKVEKLFLEASYCHPPKAWASNVKAKRGRFAFCPKISYLCRSNGADREIFGDCSVAFCLFRGETTWDLEKITKDLGKITKDLRKTTSYVVHFCFRDGFFYSLSREKWQPCKVTKMYTKIPFKKVYIKSAPACRQGPPRAPLLEKRRSPRESLSSAVRPGGARLTTLSAVRSGGSCSLPISLSAPAASPKVFPQYESVPQNTRDFRRSAKKRSKNFAG